MITCTLPLALRVPRTVGSEEDGSRLRALPLPWPHDRADAKVTVCVTVDRSAMCQGALREGLAAPGTSAPSAAPLPHGADFLCGGRALPRSAVCGCAPVAGGRAPGRGSGPPGSALGDDSSWRESGEMGAHGGCFGCCCSSSFI